MAGFPIDVYTPIRLATPNAGRIPKMLLLQLNDFQTLTSVPPVRFSILSCEITLSISPKLGRAGGLKYTSNISKDFNYRRLGASLRRRSGGKECGLGHRDPPRVLRYDIPGTGHEGSAGGRTRQVACRWPTHSQLTSN